MEFGKVEDYSRLDFIKWTLPQQDVLTRSYLQNLSKSKTHLWMGAPAWNHKQWVGKIYPEKTNSSDFLYYYSRHFNTIEMNTTHYRIPTDEQTRKWVEKVPDKFLFCPKVFQSISHSTSGIFDKELHRSWFEFLKQLDTHCGPSFLQLPPHFDYSYKALLFNFLRQWPEEFKLAIEFRHPSWFQSGVVLPALVQYLQSKEIGLVITDVAGRRDVLHSSVSSPFTMIRFIGNELHSSDYSRAELWNERLKIWSEWGLKDVFFFVHQPDDILVPDMAAYLKSLVFFNNSCVQSEST